MNTIIFKKRTGKNLLLILFLIVMSFQAKAVTPSGGDGSSSHPYQIATLADLKWVADQVNAGHPFTDTCFIQTANIDASATSTWNPNGSDGYYGWTAIGGTDDYYVFSGSYDGQGYTISNLYINNPSVNVYGLFGYCSGATIKNLGLTNVSMLANSDIGGLVGYMEPGTISNCYVTGSVTASGGTGYAGGLCAEAYTTNIDNCYAVCTVVAENGAAGGLIAYLSVGSITNSYSSGSVTVNNEVSEAGGLLGSVRSGTSVEYCFSESSVSANGVLHREPTNPDFSNVGGLIGSNGGTVANCYAKGSVIVLNAENESEIGGLLGENTGTVSYSYSICSLFVTPLSGNTPAVGGFVGANYDESSYGAIHYPTLITFEFTPGTVNNNCYWNSSVYASGCGSNSFTYLTPYTATFSATGKTTAQMKTQTTFTGWSTTIWNFVGGSYPKLLWNTTFIGTGNWSNAGNWSNGSPGLNMDVTINGACTVDGSFSTDDLTLNPGAALTIASGKSLAVGGNLILKSNATNGTATLIDNPGTVTVGGTTSVEQYLTGGTGISDRQWWYLSSPVTGATSGVFSPSGANNLGYYNETTTPPAFVPIPGDAEALVAGRGYLAQLKSTGTYVFTGGVLNSGNITITLTRTGITAGKRGFNLIGNPYPSYLNWNLAYQSATNIRPTIWYRTYTGGGTTGNGMEFETYNGALDVGIPATVNGFIPPMQGFWAKVDKDGTGSDPIQSTGSIPLTNTMRSHAGTTENPSTNRLKAPAISEKQVIRLSVSNGVNSDETVIATNANASDTYDTYDSEKMSNDNIVIPEIYTLAGTEELSINGLNSITANKELILGFRPGQASNFTIKATEISNLDEDIKVILLDKLTGAEQGLTVDSPYNFSSDATATNDRFSIRFKSASAPTGTNNPTNDPGILVYRNQNNQITVTCSAGINNQSSVSVYNVVGQKLTRQRLTNTTTEINAVLMPGVYVVAVNNGNQPVIKKVIIK